jgi:site-specific recombinase XerD
LAYQQDLRQFASWCHSQDLELLAARRIHVELFARWLEHRGAARATIGRRLSTVTGFYRYCVEEELLTRNPTANIRRPRLRQESTMNGLDRNELGAFLVQAGLSGARDHALACLLALNGLRVSAALNTDVDDIGLERGHHTLRVRRKGGKTVTIPLAPRTARTVYLAVGERSEGPIFITNTGERMNRHQAARVVRRLARHGGIDKKISPHSLRHSFITAALDAGVPYVTSKKPRHTPIPERRCATTGHDARSTGTPRASSPPSSPEHPDSPKHQLQRRRARGRHRGDVTYRPLSLPA